MIRTLPIDELEVVGFIGTFDLADAPVRLLPVFSCVATGEIVVPPSEELGNAIRGHVVEPGYWDELVSAGEAERLPSPVRAHSDWTLWLSPTGAAYEPTSRARELLAELSLSAVRDATSQNLRSASSRDRLFAALRARQTRTASALLSIHFQLIGQTDQLGPVRRDLAALRGGEMEELEARQVEAVREAKLDDRIATAIAEELRRAGPVGNELADRLLEAVDVHARSAADAPPPMGWSLAWFDARRLDEASRAAA